MPIPPELEEPLAEPYVEPPVDPSLHDLPFGSLRWDDFEKLCVRLVKRESDVEDARRFGTRGEAQSGIDIYARQQEEAEYVVYQCRQVATLTDADLRQAVDDFLAGEWASKVSEFVLCTSRSTVPVRLAREVEKQAARLREREPPVRLEIWDAEALSERLRAHPDLVEEFFGPGWLEAFLPEAAKASVGARLAEIQEGVNRIEQATTRRFRVFIFDWHPEQAREELRQLADEDADLFERLEDRIGNPPGPTRVVNLVAERPDWLVAANVRAWRALALVAEKAGEWNTATAAWREAAAQASDPYERAGVLVAAAATAGVAGDRDLHDGLLGEARELAPDHPRVRVQEVDQSLGGAERLAALEGVASDDPPVAALVACHRTLAHLLLGDVEEARKYLAEAQEWNPRSALVRMVAVNVTVQQARLDSASHRRLDYPELKRAHEQALSLLDDLRKERRYEETVRILMLAADILSLIEERKNAREVLMSATAAELATPDAAEVLGDAAVRALGWEEAIKLIEGATNTPSVERIRACALAEIGSPRERSEAIATLDRLVAVGGAEAAIAAMFRLALVTPPRPAPWSEEAAELLRREGHDAPVNVAQAFLLERLQDNPSDAARLLDEHANEVWSQLAKLRLAGMRKDKDVMVEAAGALLDRGPAQDVVIEAARALAICGDREQARRLLLGAAHDQACAPAIRADAYAHLIPLVADAGDWEAAHTLHDEWVDVRPADDRAYPWAPTIANRRGGRTR